MMINAEFSSLFVVRWQYEEGIIYLGIYHSHYSRFLLERSPPESEGKIAKDSPTISNPTTQGNQPIQRNDHIFDKPFYNPNQRKDFSQPRYKNYDDYRDYEQNQYQNRYGNSNNYQNRHGNSNNYQNRHSNKQSTFVQRLDKNQLYQSIPMPFGCPQCGYGSEKKHHNTYSYGNRYQKN